MATKLYSGTTRIYPHDALLRSANDFSTFSEKVTPVANDVLLSEDSAASYAKKKVKQTNLAQIIGQGIDSSNPNATSGSVAYTGSTNWVDLVSYTETVKAGVYILIGCADVWLTPAHSRGLVRLYNSTYDVELSIILYRIFANDNGRYPASIWVRDPFVTTDGSVTWKLQFHHVVGGSQQMRCEDGHLMVWRIS